MRLYLEKNPSQKSMGGVAQVVCPEFKLQYSKKTNQIQSHRGGWVQENITDNSHGREMGNVRKQDIVFASIAQKHQREALLRWKSLAES
jgi:hypothetical protein